MPAPAPAAPKMRCIDPWHDGLNGGPGSLFEVPNMRAALKACPSCRAERPAPAPVPSQADLDEYHRHCHHKLRAARTELAIVTADLERERARAEAAEAALALVLARMPSPPEPDENGVYGGVYLTIGAPVWDALDKARAALAGQPPAIHPLDSRLSAFVAAMKAKFDARALKHPGEQSVTHPAFDWPGMDPEPLRAHLRSEVGEWDAVVGTGLDEEAKEAVDIANMAFLIWTLAGRKEP